MRKILLGATVLAAAGAILAAPAALADDAPSYTGSDCGYATVHDGPKTVGVNAGTAADEVALYLVATTGVPSTATIYALQNEGMSGKAFFEVGACTPLGAGGVGGGLNNPGSGQTVAGIPVGENRLCGGVAGIGVVDVEYPSPVGVYAVADGNNANTPPTGGYAGVSNFETSTDAEGTPGAPSPDPTCEPNDGGGTNSGGSLGISEVNGTPVGVYAPVPLVVCGNDSSPNWAATGRDGCFID